MKVSEQLPVVALGASAGGIAPLREIICSLAQDFPAAILVTLHVGSHPSILPEILRTAGVLPANHAADGERIAAGRVYVAPPDAHMLLERGDVLRLYRGPKENGSRPAIDPMFRSLAIAKGSAAVAVVLSGLLDDGAAGLAAIKQCKGIAIVQDPNDARESQMPRSALERVSPDQVLAASQIGAALTRSIARIVSALPEALQVAAPEELVREHAMHLGLNGMEFLSDMAKPTTFSCPDCGGVLWQLADPPGARYRCHTGHAYGQTSLVDGQRESVESAVWGAVRALREQAMLLEISSRTAKDRGDMESSANDWLEAQEAQSRAQRLVAIHDELITLEGTPIATQLK